MDKTIKIIYPPIKGDDLQVLEELAKKNQPILLLTKDGIGQGFVKKEGKTFFFENPGISATYKSGQTILKKGVFYIYIVDVDAKNILPYGEHVEVVSYIADCTSHTKRSPDWAR